MKLGSESGAKKAPPGWPFLGLVVGFVTQRKPGFFVKIKEGENFNRRHTQVF